MTATRPVRKFRGNQVSLDGGATWSAGPAAGWYSDSAHAGASQVSRELAGWNPVAGSGDSDLLWDLGSLTPRSRDLDRNHGIAQSGRQTKVDNIVGIGFQLSPTPDYRAMGRDKVWAMGFSRAVRSKWRPWAETTACDMAGTQNVHGLTRQMFNGSMLNGDAVALPLWSPDARSKYATKLQVMEADRLSTPIGRIDGQHMRGGVEVDDYGKPVAYWIRKAHPGDAYIGVLPAVIQWERIEAETAWGRKRVIHVGDFDRAGQHRGKPDLTAVLTQFKMLDHYQRTEIQAAVVQAMVAAFIETPMSTEAMATMFGGDVESQAFQTYLAQKNEYRVALKGAAVLPLFPGDKMSPFTPTRPNGVYGQFVENVLRHIAAGLNLPYELLLKDFSKTNYSSARAALLEAWRFFIGRRKWLTDFWMTPVFELWMEEAVNAGDFEEFGIGAAEFYENRFAVCRCKWIGPGRGWVDPVKEATAAKLRMENNVSTLEMECAEQGLDWEEVLEQKAAERALMIELKLPLPEIEQANRPLDLQEAERADEDGAGNQPPAGAGGDE
jgi:lambda family phage portal protein